MEKIASNLKFEMQINLTPNDPSNHYVVTQATILEDCLDPKFEHF